MSVRGTSGGWRCRDVSAGMTLRHPAGRTFGRDEQLWLAWITNNASGVHGDAVRAATGTFGDVVVLGALIAAVVAGLAEPVAWPLDQVGKGLPEGWPAIRLTGIVRPGDTLRAESQIHAVDRSPDGSEGRVTRSILGRNQRNVVVVRLEETRLVAW
jgi:acyl dehydratase